MDIRWGFPENASAHGGQIDTLFWIMMAATAPFLAGTIVFVIYCLVRYRQKSHPKASFIKGFPTFWGTAILASILLLLELPMDYYQEHVWAEATIDFPSEEEALVVQVYPEQFAWNFRYKGKDGKFGTEDDITTINELNVPVGKPVLCIMRSRDVIHSFWLPHFRVKMDVMPGFTHRVWFEAAKAGRYEIACAELCGLGHYSMRAFLFAVSPEEHAEWIKDWQEEIEEFGQGDEAVKWELWDKTS